MVADLREGEPMGHQMADTGCAMTHHADHETGVIA